MKDSTSINQQNVFLKIQTFPNLSLRKKKQFAMALGAIITVITIVAIMDIKTIMAIMTFLDIKTIIHLFKIATDIKYKELVAR